MDPKVYPMDLMEPVESTKPVAPAESMDLVESVDPVDVVDGWGMHTGPDADVHASQLLVG